MSRVPTHSRRTPHQVVLERDGLRLVVGNGGDLTWDDVRALTRQRERLRGGPGPLPSWHIAVVVFVLRVFDDSYIDPMDLEEDAPPAPVAEADRFKPDTEWSKRCANLRRQQRQRGLFHG